MKTLNDYITEVKNPPVHRFDIGDKKVMVSYKSVKNGYTPWDKQHKHDDYLVTVCVDNDSNKISYHWYDSIAHSGHIMGFNEETAKSALANGAMDAMTYKMCPTAKDIMNEFGYDDEKQAKQVCKGCKELYEKFSSLFTDDEIQKISELDN